jgi:hypothetical protein
MAETGATEAACFSGPMTERLDGKRIFACRIQGWATDRFSPKLRGAAQFADVGQVQS